MKTLLPPDTTEPAPMMRCRKEPHEARGGYLHAEDDDTPYYVDGLRYCGRCHHFLDEGESHRAAPAPVATPTPDIDPEEVRRALDAFEREWGSPGGVAAQDGLTLMAAAREYLRLREQPAPDVQAQDEFRFGPCVRCGEKDIAWPQHDGAPIVCCDCQHYERGLADGKADLDAAVEREREIWVEAMNRMVPISGVREVLFRGVDRARSAKGV